MKLTMIEKFGVFFAWFLYEIVSSLAEIDKRTDEKNEQLAFMGINKIAYGNRYYDGYQGKAVIEFTMYDGDPSTKAKQHMTFKDMLNKSIEVKTGKAFNENI